MNVEKFAAVVSHPDTGLIDPWTRQDDDCKLTCMLPKETMALIRSLHPVRGTLQNMMAMMLYDVAAELESKGIKYYTPDNEKEFINVIKSHCTFAANIGQRLVEAE